MGITALLGLLLGTTLQESAALPGVVISEESHLVFCTNEERRLLALNLETGKAAWTSQDKAWPLAVMGGDLIIAALASDPHSLYLKVFSAAEGKFRVMSRPIVLPAWAKPLLNYDQTTGYEFGIRAATFDEAKVRVYWSARKWPAGGITLKPGLAAAFENGAGIEFHVGSGYISDIEPPAERVGYGLEPRGQDPANPNATILGQTAKAGARSLYLSETSSGINDMIRPLHLVCRVTDSTTPAWTFSLGKRSVPKLRM
jgi:hypothetical protein